MPRPFELKPSAPIAGLVSATFVATMSGVALGVVYALATRWIPLVNLITLAAAPMLGMFVGFAVEYALKLGRVRHSFAGMAIAIIATVTAFFTSWVVWVAAVAGTTDALALALDPSGLLFAIGAINRAGPWEFAGWRPTGFELWALWLVEAGLVAFVAYQVARGHVRVLLEKPFCPGCRAWIGEASQIANFALVDDDEWPERMRRGEWQCCEGLDISRDEDNGHRVLVAQCNCGAVQCLTVERHTHSDGGSYDYAPVLQNMVMDADEAAGLRRTVGRGTGTQRRLV